jgi:hypothetical protein
MGCDRGKIEIDEITGGIVNFDGALVISPKEASKASYGAGSNNNAIFTFNLTGTNATNTHEVDVFDQPISDDN